MNENLLKIALASLTIYKLDESDIQWVGSECGSYYMHWEMLKIKSSDCNFEHLKPGGREPARDLVIVADDWWLSWFDECGMCGFEYNSKPKLKADHKKISRLMGRFSPKLEIINGKRR